MANGCGLHEVPPPAMALYRYTKCPSKLDGMEPQASDLDFDIPPFLRKPADGTREGSEWMLSCANIKIAKLAALGLRPHPTLLDYKTDLEQQLEQGGPYVLRHSSGWF